MRGLRVGDQTPQGLNPRASKAAPPRAPSIGPKASTCHAARREPRAAAEPALADGPGSPEIVKGGALPTPTPRRSPRLAALTQSYRLESRLDVLKAFYRQKIKIYCKEKGIDEKQVTESADNKLKKEAKTQFENALVDLERRTLSLNQEDFRRR